MSTAPTTKEGVINTFFGGLGQLLISSWRLAVQAAHQMVDAYVQKDHEALLH
jgi:hypothetical protein